MDFSAAQRKTSEPSKAWRPPALHRRLLGSSSLTSALRVPFTPPSFAADMRFNSLPLRSHFGTKNLFKCATKQAWFGSWRWKISMWTISSKAPHDCSGPFRSCWGDVIKANVMLEQLDLQREQGWITRRDKMMFNAVQSEIL